MSPRTKREYLEAVHGRYKNATREQKRLILDEYCATTGCHRKHAIRQINGFKRFSAPKPKKRGRKPLYDSEAILRPLKKIWLTANLPCSKRLKPIMPLWLPGYEASFGPLNPTTRAALLQISAATIDRLLQPTRKQMEHRGRATTKPGSLLRSQIPLGTNQWDQDQPGFLEADTVAHCGASMAGQFANSLDCVDIATTWTEQRAVWGRGEQGVLQTLQDIEESLPFDIRGFDCDNGAEFLNRHLVRHFTQRPQPVLFTRSRAYQKNDNAHVEQKNWTKVRQLLGYARYDKPELVALVDELYRNEWRLLQNFFQPVMKLEKKERHGSRVKKWYDEPKTLAQRLLNWKGLGKEKRSWIESMQRTLDPIALSETVNRKLQVIRRALREGVRRVA